MRIPSFAGRQAFAPSAGSFLALLWLLVQVFVGVSLFGGCANTLNRQEVASGAVRVYVRVMCPKGAESGAFAVPLVWIDLLRQGTEASSRGEAELKAAAAVNSAGDASVGGPEE